MWVFRILFLLFLSEMSKVIVVDLGMWSLLCCFIFLLWVKLWVYSCMAVASVWSSYLQLWALKHYIGIFLIDQVCFVRSDKYSTIILKNWFEVCTVCSVKSVLWASPDLEYPANHLKSLNLLLTFPFTSFKWSFQLSLLSRLIPSSNTEITSLPVMTGWQWFIS